MLLGLISLLLAQWARWISKICVNSSLFNSKFYICSENGSGIEEHVLLRSSFSFQNESSIPPKGIISHTSHQCGEVNFFSYLWSNFIALLVNESAILTLVVNWRVTNRLFHSGAWSSFTDFCLFLVSLMFFTAAWQLVWPWAWYTLTPLFPSLILSFCLLLELINTAFSLVWSIHSYFIPSLMQYEFYFHV